MTVTHSDELDVEYDLFDPSCHERAYECYERLLQRPSLYPMKSGMIAVSKYEDVRGILSRPEIFSSRPNQSEAMGMVTAGDPAATAAALELAASLVKGMPFSPEELLSGRMIVAADPPHHTHLRSIVNRGFIPRRVAQWSDFIEARVSTLLQGVDGTAPYDVNELAIGLPVAVICEVLSMSQDMRGDVKKWTDGIINAAQGADRGTPEATTRLFGHFREFVTYFTPGIEDRRVNPRNDLITDLVRAEGQDTLTSVETLLFLLVMMGAGNETSTSLIGNTVILLMQHREQLEVILADPSLIPRAVEESLRYWAPIQAMFREATEDTTIGDQAVPKGSMFAVLVGAANRDPRQFPDPNRFDIRRPPKNHLAFGHGIHSCIGSHLARLEATIALREILPILAKTRLSDEPLERTKSLVLHAYERIELVPAT